MTSESDAIELTAKVIYRDEMLERMICSGRVERYGLVKEVLYDPVTRSQEGLDGCCFFCGAWPIRADVVEHETTCPYVEAMELLGHALPAGHTVKDEHD